MNRNDEMAQYAAIHTSPEPALLRELNRDTHLRMLYPQMLSGHYQGRLLAMLSKLYRPKYILEVGTYTGYSALCLAEGLHPGGELHTIEINREFESRILEWFGKSDYAHQIHLHIGNAISLVPDLLMKTPFNMIFLDGAKSDYPELYTLLRSHLTPGAIIVADNVLWDGKVLPGAAKKPDPDTSGIIEFNRMVADDPGTEQVMIPVRDGLSVIRVLA